MPAEEDESKSPSLLQLPELVSLCNWQRAADAEWLLGQTALMQGPWQREGDCPLRRPAPKPRLHQHVSLSHAEI